MISMLDTMGLWTRAAFRRADPPTERFADPPDPDKRASKLGGGSDEDKRAFEDGDKRIQKMMKDVVQNTKYRGPAGCQAEVAQFYAEEWLPFAKAIQEEGLFSGGPDWSKLNGLLGRINGLEIQCAGGSPHNQARGVDPEADHPLATAINQTMPGGAPSASPPKGGSSYSGWYVAGGLTLIGAGVLLGRRI